MLADIARMRSEALRLIGGRDGTAERAAVMTVVAASCECDCASAMGGCDREGALEGCCRRAYSQYYFGDSRS